MFWKGKSRFWSGYRTEAILSFIFFGLWIWKFDIWYLIMEIFMLNLVLLLPYFLTQDSTFTYLKLSFWTTMIFKTVWFFMRYLFRKKIIFMEKKFLLSKTLVSSLSFLPFSFSSFVSFLSFCPCPCLRMSSKQDFAPRSRRNGTSNSDWYQALRLFCKKIREKIYWAIIIHYFPIFLFYGHRKNHTEKQDTFNTALKHLFRYWKNMQFY